MGIDPETNVIQGRKEPAFITAFDPQGGGIDIDIGDGSGSVVDSATVRSGQAYRFECIGGNTIGPVSYYATARDSFGGTSASTPFQCVVQAPDTLDTPSDTPWGIFGTLIAVGGTLGIAACIGSCIRSKKAADYAMQAKLQEITRDAEITELQTILKKGTSQLANTPPTGESKDSHPRKRLLNSLREQAQAAAEQRIVTKLRETDSHSDLSAPTAWLHPFITTHINPLLPEEHQIDVTLGEESKVVTAGGPAGGSPTASASASTLSITISPCDELFEHIQLMGLACRNKAEKKMLLAPLNNTLLRICQYFANQILAFPSALSETQGNTLADAERHMEAYIKWLKLWQQLRPTQTIYGEGFALLVTEQIDKLLNDLERVDATYAVHTVKFTRLFSLLDQLIVALHQLDWKRGTIGSRTNTLKRQTKIDLSARLLKHLRQLEKYLAQDKKRLITLKSQLKKVKGTEDQTAELAAEIETLEHSILTRKRCILAAAIARASWNAAPEANPAKTWRTCCWLGIWAVARNIARLGQTCIYLTKFKPGDAAAMEVFLSMKHDIAYNLTQLRKSLRETHDGLSYFQATQAVLKFFAIPTSTLAIRRDMSALLLTLYTTPLSGAHSDWCQEMLQADIRKAILEQLNQDTASANPPLQHVALSVALTLLKTKDALTPDQAEAMRTAIQACVTTQLTLLNNATSSDHGQAPTYGAALANIIQVMEYAEPILETATYETVKTTWQALRQSHPPLTLGRSRSRNRIDTSTPCSRLCDAACKYLHLTAIEEVQHPQVFINQKISDLIAAKQTEVVVPVRHASAPISRRQRSNRMRQEPPAKSCCSVWCCKRSTTSTRQSSVKWSPKDANPLFNKRRSKAEHGSSSHPQVTVSEW